MNDLTEPQCQAMGNGDDLLRDPHSKTKYVLVRQEVYERMAELIGDDTPWSAWERDRVARKAAYNHYQAGGPN
jgi:hypothetical protein